MTPIWQKIQKCLYTITHFILFYLNKVLQPLVYLAVSRVKFYGRENMPKQRTGVLVIANHMSYWDIPFTFGVIRRPFFMMAKSEFLEFPVVGVLAKLLGGYGVKRGTPDRQALQYTVDLLKRGAVVGIYPEGTRSKVYAMNEGQPGILLVAQLADPLIVPVAISGSENMVKKRPKLFHRPQVTVKVGKPFKIKDLQNEITTGLSRRAQNEELLELLMSKIAELLPPEYQGYYAVDKVAQRKEHRLQTSLAETAKRKLKKEG
jgi:1-acyl-sn-glycerol-3-phosphate acyltransferase